MKTKNFWKGSFGDEYAKRNRVDWQRRVPFWKNIILTTGARSVLEFGCGSGWNLSAIKRSFPDVDLQGMDVNQTARSEAMVATPNIWENWRNAYKVELVFTSGVLIHISPEDLLHTMSSLYNYSTDYILAIEYHEPEETEVKYRGYKEKLWKRPYGDLYLHHFPNLTLVSQGYLQKKEGFDECDYWLFRK